MTKRILSTLFACLLPLSFAHAQSSGDGSAVLMDGQALTADQLALIMASIDDCGVEEPETILNTYRQALVEDDPLGGIVSFNDLVIPYVTKIGEMNDTVLAVHCEQVNNFVSQMQSQ